MAFPASTSYNHWNGYKGLAFQSFYGSIAHIDRFDRVSGGLICGARPKRQKDTNMKYQTSLDKKIYLINPIKTKISEQARSN